MNKSSNSKFIKILKYLVMVFAFFMCFFGISERVNAVITFDTSANVDDIWYGRSNDYTTRMAYNVKFNKTNIDSIYFCWTADNGCSYDIDLEYIEELPYAV